MRKNKMYDGFSSNYLHTDTGELVLDNETFNSECQKFWNSIYLNRFWENTDPSPTALDNFKIPCTSFPNSCILDSISDDEVSQSLSEIKNKSSVGSSGIPPEWLKSLDRSNRNLLRKLFQHWYDEERFPKDSLVS